MAQEMSTPVSAIKGFVAGCLAVATFFFAAWWAAQAAGFIPANAPAIWSLDPKVPPFGVPRPVSLVFWGGVWGLVLALLFRELDGAAYWLAWILAGAIAVAAVAVFVVPAIKGAAFAVPPAQRLMVAGFLNGVFGLGAAVWLRVLGR